MALRFFARYKQLNKNVQGTIGDPIRYDLQAGVVMPQNTIIAQNTGAISHPIGFAAYPNWYEFTEDITDGIGIKIKVGGNDKTGESKRLLYTDSDIECSGEMARFIFFHLVNNANARYNAIQVRVEDDSCGDIFTYPIFVITSDNIEFEVCDDSQICSVKFNIREDSDVKSCLESTLIDVSPNSKGNSYFDDFVGAIHPRFHVGYDKKNTGLYILFAILTTSLFFLAPFFNLIFGWIFGLGFRKLAPYIRTYLNNVCEHCNLRLDTTPFILGSPVVGSQVQIEPKRGLGSVYGATNSPYYGSTIMYDSTLNRIRYTDPTTWQSGISPISTGANFIDKMAEIINGKWEIYGNTLFIHRKDSVLTSTPILDFSNNQTHLDWLNDCIKITTIGAKKSPKYAELKYGEDMETEGTKMKSSYERVANFGFQNYTSTFGGSKKIDASQFGMIQTTDDITTGYFNTKGYIEETIYNVFPSPSAQAWFLTSGLVRPSTGAAPYAIISLSEEAWNAWKLVDHDTSTPILDAEPKEINVQPYEPYNLTLRVYDKLGLGLIGNRPTYQKRNAIWHFDSEYTDNLFYYFYYIEDTARFPQRSEKANIKLKLCCQTIRKLGLNSPNKASIDFLMKIPINGKDILFQIEEMEIDYERNEITIDAPVYRFNDSNRF